MKPITLAQLRARINHALWGQPLRDLRGWRRACSHAIRIAYMMLREFLSGGLSQRAASLVFTTILSLVPLLAVSFSVMKGFGVHYRIEQLLFNLMAPLGPQGQEFAVKIVAFVDNVKVGVLGGVGLVILLFTVLSLLQKVEASLNHSWRVRHTRSFAARFSGYLSVLLIGPLLVITALGIIGAVMGTVVVQTLSSIEPFGTLIALATKLMPYILIILAFTFIYQFMPNTDVNFRSAAVGGVVAGALWATAGWGFASFIVNSPESNYAAIYSSFAIVFFFLLWLYVAWAILLTGGTVAFYHQHPEYLGVMPRELSLSNRLRERLAVALLVRVGRAHLDGDGAPNVRDLASQMNVPTVLVEDTVEALVEQRFIVRSVGPTEGLLPARDVHAIALSDVLSSIRSAFELGGLSEGRLHGEPEAEQLMQELESNAAGLLAGRTLADLLRTAQTSAPREGAEIKRIS